MHLAGIATLSRAILDRETNALWLITVPHSYVISANSFALEDCDTRMRCLIPSAHVISQITVIGVVASHEFGTFMPTNGSA